MEYKCSSCKYSTGYNLSNATLVCNRVLPLLYSEDPKVLEYLVDAKNTTKMIVFCDFCCIKWVPKNETS